MTSVHDMAMRLIVCLKRDKMSKVELAVKIENVVASGTLKNRIDLNAVVQTFPEAEYRPRQFPGARALLAIHETSHGFD